MAQRSEGAMFGDIPDDVLNADFASFFGNDLDLNGLDQYPIYSSNHTADPNQTQPLYQDQQMPQLPPQPLPSTPIAPPPMVADQSRGAYYDPRIGWYFPAVYASAAPTPSTQHPSTPVVGMLPSRATTPFISEGFTPTTSMPPSQIPSRVPSPGPAKRKAKQQYGPAAYLKDQMKQRLDGNVVDRQVSEPAIVNSKGKSAKKASHSLRDAKTRTIVQACVCNDKEAQKIKRPKNAFILFRSANSQAILRESKTRSNQEVSRVAAQKWKNASDATRQKFFNLAEEEKQRHAAMYPDYQYRPGVSSRNKFGSASCRCGAYQANLAASLAEDSAQDSVGELEEYEPAPRTTRPILQAPTALMSMPQGSSLTAQMMMTQQAPFRDPPDMHPVATAPLAGAGAQANLLSQKRGAEDQDFEMPVAKRRSQRPGRKNVDYNEAEEADDIFQFTALDNQSLSMTGVDPSRLLLVPTPAGPANDKAAHADALGEADDLFIKGPAYNTRSNSLKGKTPSPVSEFIWQDLDWNATDAAMFQDLFGELVEDDGEDTMHVTRRSSKTQIHGVQGSPAMSTRSRSKSIELVSPRTRDPPRKNSKKSSR